MDRNLVVRRRPIRQERREKEADIPWLRRKPIKPLHGACSVHEGLRRPLDGVKVQSVFSRGS